MASRRGRAGGSAAGALLRLLLLVAVLVAGLHGATGPDRTPGAGPTVATASAGTSAAKARTPEPAAGLAHGHHDQVAVSAVAPARATPGPLLPAALRAPAVVAAPQLLLGQLPRPPDPHGTSTTRTTWQGRAPPPPTGT